MTILRVGATRKYSDNFEQAFGRKKSAGKAAAKSAKKKGATKKKAKRK